MSEVKIHSLNKNIPYCNWYVKNIKHADHILVQLDQRVDEDCYLFATYIALAVKKFSRESTEGKKRMLTMYEIDTFNSKGGRETLILDWDRRDTTVQLQPNLKKFAQFQPANADLARKFFQEYCQANWSEAENKVLEGKRAKRKMALQKYAKNAHFYFSNGTKIEEIAPRDEDDEDGIEDYGSLEEDLEGHDEQDYQVAGPENYWEEVMRKMPKLSIEDDPAPVMPIDW
jgi:hypothetical protein